MLQEVEKITETYVEFLFPGILFPEESVRKVESRGRPKRIPKNAFAYSFFDVEKTTVGKKTFDGPRKNFSKRFYPGGTIYTIKDIKREFPDKTILISNMECNGWKKLVKTRMGNFQPFEKGDKIV